MKTTVSAMRKCLGSSPLGPVGAWAGTTIRLLKTTLALAASLAAISSLATANPLGVGTTSMNFTDGSTATGFFDFNTATGTITSWDFQLSASGVFGTEEYSSAATGVGASSIILSNTNGDEVFSFFQVFGTDVNEFDIVVSCGGVVNCLTQASTGASFALATGVPSCPPGNKCVTSGEQFQVPTAFVTRLLSPGFLNVTDPPGVLAFNLDSVATGTVFGGGGGNNNGGGGNSVPEPGILSLLGTGLVGLAGARLRKKAVATN